MAIVESLHKNGDCHRVSYKLVYPTGNRVVFSESCPILSLITEIGMFLLLAMLAQAWRATYMVKGDDSPNDFPITFK